MKQPSYSVGKYKNNHRMVKYSIQILTWVVLFFILIGSASGKDTEKKAAPEANPLKVGVTANYPPIIFKLANKIAGVEVDLANLLGEKLQRPVEFVELRWEEQISYLLEGKTDIIMSGMSITEAREVRIQFTTPYLKSGIITAMRVEDKNKYDTSEKIIQTSGVVGVIGGTTGDVFAKRKLRNARRIISLPHPNNAGFELKRGRIDIFLHDAPSIVWLVSENEADLAGFWNLLTEEDLAWGIRKDDPEFLERLNGIVNAWKADGTLTKVIKKWIPYMELP